MNRFALLSTMSTGQDTRAVALLRLLPLLLPQTGACARASVHAKAPGSEGSSPVPPART